MYSKFDRRTNTQLVLMRRRFFMPWYELTDGQLTYGRLSFQGFMRRNAVVETADSKWLFEHDGFFTRTILIRSGGEVIGRLTRGLFGSASLRMIDGFEAEFSRQDILPAIFAWNTTRFGEVVKLKQDYFTLFTFRSIDITIDPNSMQVPVVPLLCFLGSYLIILRKRRKAAAR